MAVEYVKPKSGDVNLVQLQAEINSATAIVPSCTSVSRAGDELTLTFAAALNSGEEAGVEAIIAAHVANEAYIAISELPKSPETGKIAMHASAKPLQSQQTYAVWAGAGDDMTTAGPGEGPLLSFFMTPGVPSVSVDIKFHPNNGKVWINEGYFKFDGAGAGDTISATVMAPATAVQTVANKNMIIEDGWIKFAPGGPGTGTHGFAATPVLIPRNFSRDGHWDFDGTNLLPNLTNTGQYKISNVEQVYHKYINRIPVYGSSHTYVNMASDDTAGMPYPYFIRVTCANASNGTWNLQAFMEIYREKTAP
jgi:hypothetical protein